MYQLLHEVVQGCDKVVYNAQDYNNLGKRWSQPCSNVDYNLVIRWLKY